MAPAPVAAVAAAAVLATVLAPPLVRGLRVDIIFDHALSHLREIAGSLVGVVGVAAPLLEQVKEMDEGPVIALQNALDVPETICHRSPDD